MKGLEAFDWASVESELDLQGHSTLPGLLTAAESEAWAASASNTSALTAAIDLEPIEQGRGELRRFRDRLTGELGAVRALLYRKLVATANRWAEAMSEERRYPESLDAFMHRRQMSGARAERSALSRLRESDYWGLHQGAPDELSFPLQISLLLSQPGRDFSGGELVLVEQRPRMQSRPIVVVPQQGDALIFAVHRKPFRGVKGFYRVNLKHAVSRVLSGHRTALELCF